MAQRVPITIRVDRFEGPLDLLLYLIQSHELDVSKISISKITDQYLAYVRLMQELNFDIASDFLLMAATLIQWKSKSLLPVEIDPNALLGADEDDILSPEELLRQLREHQRFLEAGRELGLQPLMGEDNYPRPNSRKPTEKIWKQMDITALALTYQDLLVKERKRTTILKKETVSIAEKIIDFSDRMEVGKLTALTALLRDPTSNPETVVSFLATLELGRLRKLKVYQEKAYDEIYVELLESIKGFDTALASGFDAIESTIADDIKKRDAGRAEDAARADAGLPPLERGGPDANAAGPDFIPNAAGFSPSAERFAETHHTYDDGTDTGVAAHGGDLADFGESAEPDLRAALSGTEYADDGAFDGNPADRGDGVSNPSHGRGDGESTDDRNNARTDS